MAGVHRNSFTESMKTDSYDYFWEAYPDVPPKHESIFEVVKSENAYEQFSSAIGLGQLLEKPEGEDLKADAPMESYTIVCKNRTFGRLVRFSYETVKDVKKIKNMVAESVGTWGRQLPITKDLFYADIFNKGALTAGDSVFNNTISQVVTDASGNLIYDGQPFFSDSHPNKVGVTFDNYNSANALSAANLRSAYETYTQTNNRDERGAVIELTPDVLLIPPALKFTAQEILESTLVPYVTNNTQNVLKSILPIMEWAHLTDTDGWFIGKLQSGLMATDREDVTLDFWQDETSKDYFASILTRFGGCVTNWRYWLANNIASS